MNKKTTSIVLIIFIIINFVNCVLPISVSAGAEYNGAYVPTDYEIYSRGAYMLNLNTDTVVYAKNADRRMYPASLTKIMTAIIVLEECGDPAEEKIIVPSDTSIFDEIYKVGGSNIALKAGEVLTVKDLLYSLMLPSACDSATLLAYYFGGGKISDFVEKMNAKAKELGAENTNFMNPHGLHDDNHYTSPADMSLFIKYALKFPLFNEIISTPEYTIPATDKTKERKIEYTISMLLNKNDEYYKYMKGIKSGFTAAAGRCLMSMAEKDGEKYILVLMGANLDQPAVSSEQANLTYADTKSLYEYAFSHFAYRQIITENEKLKTERVRNGNADSIDIFSENSVYALLPIDKEAELVYSMPETLLAPLAPGTIGNLYVYYNGKCFGETRLMNSMSVPAISSGIAQPGKSDNQSEPGKDTRIGADDLQKLFEDRPFLILLIILFAFIILFVSVLVLSRKASGKSKKARFR
ncbi:MAG: D-alanyl-D-alanine carboxypeptidase family protein [Oscillospiraceae bacterium]|nr:D-alanyl-D-alanine carboxypeptidase family protein [Oscillospiraceae bacterium]